MPIKGTVSFNYNPNPSIEFLLFWSKGMLDTGYALNECFILSLNAGLLS